MASPHFEYAGKPFMLYWLHFFCEEESISEFKHVRHK